FFSSFGRPATNEVIVRGIRNIAVFGAMTMLPLVIYEFISRKKGSSLWIRMKRVYYELLYEARVNNEIVKRHTYSPDKIPIILLYGFGSSRKALNIMETLLTKRGFEVMSFNLGGSLGVFFTRGIKETADFIDRKIQRQMKRYGFKKVHIVAHSKGGLVALWWLLRLGGSEYCDKIVTLGTPFKGTWLTYLAMFTPFGLFFKDVWQMAPGSTFLQELHASPPASGLKIYTIYSEKDKVATGKSGIFEHASNITPIAMNHVAHFQFLARRDVAQAIIRILLHDNDHRKRGRRKRDLAARSANGESLDEHNDEINADEERKQLGSQPDAV
ncbi:MAG: alpha/beta fold hydrolase, partial [Proteobacteria bacterium]|nr:alpha/beta fold hydrolase [Pseudomonadota bacterium]